MEKVVLWLRHRGVEIKWPMEAIVRASHRMEARAPWPRGADGGCPACEGCSTETEWLGCTKCGACEAAARQHMCPRATPQEMRRMMPGSLHREAATKLLGHYTRRDG